jgi:hypothetical protein
MNQRHSSVADEAAEYTGQSDGTARWDCPETLR